MTRPWVRAVIISTAILLAVGCCSTAFQPTRTGKIKDRNWVLIAKNGITPADAPRITMELKPINANQGRISGLGPCNRYFGGYRIEGKRLIFTPMGSTMMTCITPMMKEEREYLNAFEKASQMSISKNRLQLRDSEGRNVMTYGLETSLVEGRIESIRGGFPGDSDVIVRLQDVRFTNTRYGVIGMQTIRLREAVPGALPFSVSYAPERVNPEQTYGLYVQVINKGKVIYRGTLSQQVDLSNNR